MKCYIEECGETVQCAISDGIRNRFLNKTVQNDLLECCGEEIVSEILSIIQESWLYNIGFDETTDIIHRIQMTIFLRYAHRQFYRIYQAWWAWNWVWPWRLVNFYVLWYAISVKQNREKESANLFVLKRHVM